MAKVKASLSAGGWSRFPIRPLSRILITKGARFASRLEGGQIMSDHQPIITPIVVQPSVPAEVLHVTHEGASRPAPTVQEEHLADDLFSPAQQRAVAAVLGMQTGLALLHTIALEAVPAPEEKPVPRRKAEDEPAAP
jgi:hypothetical protein